MIVRNETNVVHRYIVFDNEGKIVEMSVDHPGQGVCSETYPDQADSLKEHNRIYGKGNADE